jgi:hypothetical protein
MPWRQAFFKRERENPSPFKYPWPDQDSSSCSSHVETQELPGHTPEESVAGLGTLGGWGERVGPLFMAPEGFAAWDLNLSAQLRLGNSSVPE